MRTLVMGAFSLWLGAGACGEVRRPELCVFRAADVADPTTVEVDECRAWKLSANDGDILYVLHELPQGVEIDANLDVTVTTPFEKKSFVHAHADRRVLFAFAAPKGASCSLEVTASILNERKSRVSLPVNDAACLTLGNGGAAGAGGDQPGGAGGTGGDQPGGAGQGSPGGGQPGGAGAGGEALDNGGASGEASSG